LFKLQQLQNLKVQFQAKAGALKYIQLRLNGSKYRWLFVWGLQHPEHEDHHSLPSSAVVYNAQNLVPKPPIQLYEDPLMHTNNFI
jgi:hypothetical protein